MWLAQPASNAGTTNKTALSWEASINDHLRASATKSEVLLLRQAFPYNYSAWAAPKKERVAKLATLPIFTTKWVQSMSACCNASISVWNKSQGRPGGNPGTGGVRAAPGGCSAEGIVHHACGARGGHPFHLQPYRNLLLPRRERIARGRGLVPTLSQTQGRGDRALHLPLSRPVCGASPTARGRRPRFNDLRRAANTWPDERGLSRRASGRHRRHSAGPAVPAHLLGRQAGAHRYRHRLQPGVGGLCRGQPRQTNIQRPVQAQRAADRRRRAHRTHRPPPPRARHRPHRHRQPHGGEGPCACQRVRRLRHCAWRHTQSLGRGRSRHFFHRESTAHPRQGRDRPRRQAAQAPAHADDRHRRAARHRPRGRRLGRHLPLHRRRPAGDYSRRAAFAPGGGETGRGNHRKPGRPLHGLAALAGCGRHHPHLSRQCRIFARSGVGQGQAPAGARRCGGRGARANGPHPHQQTNPCPQRPYAPGRFCRPQRGTRNRPRTFRSQRPAFLAPVKPSIRSKLETLSERLQELNALLADPAVINSHERFRALSREYAQINPVVACFQRYQIACADIASARDMMQDSDSEVRQMAEEELYEATARQEDLEWELSRLLLPTDPLDSSNIFLEIRAGTGGDEAALFAGDLYRMYTRYAERQGWQVELISESPGEHGGYKEIIVRLIGQGVYSRLKFESGTHRVQRVPQPEAQGRIHTSAATVAVLPEVEEVNQIDINPADLKVDTYRASGAGGQHVNKTDSAIRITHLPSGIVVECQDERSQHKNRARAMSLLQSKLLSAEREKQTAQQSETRRLQVGSGDRSERIRTYNFPQGRITDHRINLTLYKLESIMEGNLNELIDALINEHQTEQLAALGD